jgi:hypothetical protein
MKAALAGLLMFLPLGAGWAVAAAPPEAPKPLAAHRAVYTISLAGGSGSSAPVSAAGLIAYEFRGSACEGYATNFRQVTQLLRGEGEPMSSDTRSVTFEGGDAKTLRFRIDSEQAGTPEPQIDGSATRTAAGDISVNLSSPQKKIIDLGQDILFPTQHVARIIDHAKAGDGVLQARVFDGSDTGEKIFDTLTVIGKASTEDNADVQRAPALKSIRRWPITISYFDSSKPDGAPEYVLSFDLYENGVSGSLKLDYGAFALDAQLSQIEMLPVAACP